MKKNFHKQLFFYFQLTCALVDFFRTRQFAVRTEPEAFSPGGALLWRCAVWRFSAPFSEAIREGRDF